MQHMQLNLLNLLFGFTIKNGLEEKLYQWLDTFHNTEPERHPSRTGPLDGASENSTTKDQRDQRDQAVFLPHGCSK